MRTRSLLADAADAPRRPRPRATAERRCGPAITERAADPATASLAAVTELGPEGVTAAISSPSSTERVTRVAAGLAAIGVTPGTRVALLVPPGADLTAALYGLWRAGAVAVVVDAGLGVRGMRTALRSAGPAYVVGDAKGLAAAKVMATGARLDLGRPDAGGRAPNGARRPPQPRRRSSDSAATRPRPRPPAGDDPAVIAFTSGATGPAKGVLYLHRQLQAQRDALAALYAITADDRLVAAFGPFALFGAALGIPSAVPDMDLTSPRTLTAHALGDAAAAVDATLVFASPAALANVVATATDVGPHRRRRRWPGCGCCSPPGRRCRPSCSTRWVGWCPRPRRTRPTA